MRGVKPRIAEAGAALAFVGSGAPHFARDFQQAYAPDCQVFSDMSGATYEGIGARSGVLSTLGPQVLGAARRALAAGFRQGTTQGRAFVQGGVLILLPGDRVAWSYISSHAGDHPRPEAVTAALRTAVAAAVPG